MNTTKLKKYLKKIPILGAAIWFVKGKIFPNNWFVNSEDYWKKRYESGGNSGAGSYNKLAEFKAEIINAFVEKNNIQTVIELGCGDGNQLKYFRFPAYIGFDISDFILEKCRKQFANDKNKQFLNMSDISYQKSDLTLSLDVIYHLVEDDVYGDYMNKLFDLSDKYVIIYALDAHEWGDEVAHVKARKFTDWIKTNRPNFKLIQHIPNKYPFINEKQDSTSISDFYIYKKNS